MLRNLAVLMSTLVAMSAQAQDAPTAPSAADKQPAASQASRGPGESQHPLSPRAKPTQPDAGVDATNADEPNDCGMENSFFAEQPPPFAIRSYDSPPVTAASPEQGIQPQVWDAPPSVSKAGRCGPKYVIQIRSRSNEPFAVKDAKLVGVDGEVLNVIHSRSRVRADNMSINIISVERTKNVSEPDYRLVAILLIGEDGRAYVLPSVVLP